MSFLIFDDETLADEALQRVNDNFGCPIHLPDGYVMNTWDDIIKKFDDDFWGFYRAPDDYMDGVDGWIDEPSKVPSDWFPPDEG